MKVVGNVTRMKNLCFKSNRNKANYVLDHAYKIGRPVLIFAEDEEYMYYFTMTSKGLNKYGKKFNDVFEINMNHCGLKDSYINVCEIYRKKIHGYEELGYLDDNDMANLLKYFRYYQEHINKDEYYDEVSPIINEYLNDIKVKHYINI